MSATTRLSVTGGSQAANASYAGKVPASGKASGPFTRLHVGAHSRAYAIDSYAGKVPGGSTKAAGPFSRLHPGAHSRAYAVDSYAGKAAAVEVRWVSSLHMAGHSRARPLGSFAGKVPAPEVESAGTYIPSIARRGRRGR